MSTAAVLLETRELGARRGNVELFSGLSFAVTEGELLTVRGPNGSGKTTLLRMLCGLGEPSAGSILWRGEAVAAFDTALRQGVIYFGHATAVKDELTAIENLEFGLALAGLPADNAVVEEALRQVGLYARRQVPARRLSQGQRRRLGLARLLLAHQPLWLLDEPGAALDRQGLALLAQTVAEHLLRGGAALVSTHQDLGIPAARARELLFQ
ncbi:MAG: cytochrome c biogenesis heme-transporting ATPase CcmA [Betaproteobacteria bacterium]|nr:cytochrome c biogenesis heme-transporting ATPase CcmA [Betaproteobacteria bacterium]